MNDLELEELEAHLYSQVYHSNEEINHNLNTLPFENQQPLVDTMKKPNRYFQKSPRKSGTWFQNKQVIATQHNQKSSPCNSDDQTQGIYSKNCTRPHKRDISINQLVVISPQQAPIVCVTKTNSNKQKKRWRAKLKEKRKRRKLIESLKSKGQEECDVITLSDSDGDSCVEVSNHWPIVSVADSDDEANKGEKAEEPSDVTTRKDTNLSTPNLDDVIFVEPVNTPVEIINLDEDVDNTQKNCEDVNTHVDIETASVTSSNNSFINNYVQLKSVKTHPHQERKELLNTPDSASNDFMQNVEINQDNFNFSLHGRDFNNDKFLKPSNPTDTCETESSTSTTELNAQSSMKTVVFNEIEFPKDDMFADANLESFGNFITPLRHSRDKQTIQSSPVRKASDVQDENAYASSDSSSESDYDEISIDKQKETVKSKHLPDLSPMHSNNEKTSRKGVKKTKKGLNVSSKYDLINPTVSEVKKSKQKKRKSLPNLEALNSSKKKNKNKKRKTDSFVDTNQASEIMTEEVVSSNTGKSSTVYPDTNQSGAEEDQIMTTQNVDVDGEIKQKKKKSIQLLDETAEHFNNNQLKKRRNKKKKNNIETEADENVTDVETSVILQQVVRENPIKESSNVESTNQMDAQSDNVAVSDQMVELEQSSLVLEVNGSLKTAQGGADTTQVTKSEESIMAVQEEPQLNRENIPESPKKTLETSTDDVILIEQPPHPEIVLSSDSESNLSPLQDKYDIQLVNCGQPVEPPPPPNISVSEGPSRPYIDLSNSTVEEVQHTMSSDPKLWIILDSDRITVREDARGRRCNRCREKGHMGIRCPNKVTPKCHLCGEPGHYEPRCPNRICTQCGKRSPYSTTYCKFCFKFRSHQCEICFMMGHGSDTCPDLWRRYHLTTTEGPLTTSNGPVLKPKNKLWCSGCARPGHLEYTCRFFQSMYPPADPHIKSYEDVYQIRRTEQTQGMRPPVFYNTVQPNPVAQLAYPNSYQANNFVMNPFVNNALGPMFQQNPVFFNSGGANMYPTNQINLVHNQQRSSNNFYFEDNLPNFISFDSSVPTPNTNYQMVDERPYYNSNENVAPATSTSVDNDDRRPPRGLRQNTAIFYSSPAENIQRFISSELNILFQLSCRLIDTVRNLKKQRLEFPGNHRRNRYYRTLNMVLFGIYKLLEGEKHLVKLKTFKVKSVKAKLSQQRRHDLYRSYSYIFGIAAHDGVDYNELLRRI